MYLHPFVQITHTHVQCHEKNVHTCMHEVKRRSQTHIQIATDNVHTQLNQPTHY